MQIEFVLKAEDQASSPIEKVNSALSGLGDVSGGAESAFGRIAGGLANIAQYAIGGLVTQGINDIGNAIRGLASDAINSLSSFEQYEVQFGVLLGSADAAKQRMQELAEFGYTTPFELPQVVEADRVLQNFGFHATDAKERFGYAGEEILRIAGDVASGTGAGFTEISDLLGRFSSGTVGEAIRRMQELGITTKTQLEQMGLAFDSQGALILGTGEKTAGWTKEAIKAQEALPKLSTQLDIAKQRLVELQAKTDVSASSMMSAQAKVSDLEAAIADANETIKTGWVESQGAPTLDQATNILLDIMKKKYGGMMEQQSLTFEGMLSNLSDWKEATLRQIGSPVFELLKDKLKAVLDFVGSPEAKAAIDGFAAGLAAFVASDVVPFLESVMAAIPGVISWIAQLGAQIQTAFYSPDVQGFIGAIVEVTNAIINLATSAGPTIDQITKFLSENVKLSDVLTGVGIAIMVGIVPALAAAAVAAAEFIIPILAIIGVVALLRQAWESDFMGIRTTLTDFWVNQAQPALIQLQEWLQVNIPVAIAALKVFWDTQLMPALQQLWTFLSTYVFPILKQLVETYLANLQKSTQQTSTYFDTVLMPALQRIWQFIQTNVMPIVNALGNVISAVLGLALRVVGGYIQNILIPGFNVLVSFIREHVVPIFNEIARVVRDVLTPPLQWLYNNVIQPLARGFDSMGINVQNITRMLNDFANSINNVHLPPWLEPGSPTPFEMGLRGIQDAMQQLNGVGVPSLSMGLSGAGGAAVGGSSSLSIGQIIFQGQSAPATKEEADKSASLFLDAVKSRGQF